jgi:hypothetical protein
MYCPPHMVAKLIGKKGAMIKDLKARSRCHIQACGVSICSQPMHSPLHLQLATQSTRELALYKFQTL